MNNMEEYSPKKVRKVGKTGRSITNNITNSLANITNSLTNSITYILVNPSKSGNIPSITPSNSSNIPSNSPHSGLISLISLTSLIVS